MILYSILALIFIAIDQATKIIISSTFTATTDVVFIPNIINFVYLKNTGAAFSMFSEHIEILGIISIAFCIGLLIYIAITKPKHHLQKTSLMLIFAGALGNGIDRVFRGFVVDFIQTKFMVFPVFNIADICICVGAGLLILYVIFFEKSENKE